MPGVVVTTAVRRGARNTVNNATSTLFVVGDAERGAVNTVRTVTSLEQFEALFGGYVSHAFSWQTLQSFFEEGGSTANFVRIAPASAVVSYVSLYNVAEDAIVKISAVGAGAFANTNLTVTATTTTGTDVNVKLLLNGVSVAETGSVEDAKGAVAAINASAAFGVYVTAEILEEFDDELIDPTATAQAFASGTNGSAVPTSDQITAALELFLDTFGGGAVCAPGYPSLATHKALIAHANAYNRFAIMSAGDETSDVQAALSFVTAIDNANTLDTEHGAMFYPWVIVPYGNGTLTVPPEGYVAGVRARVHTTSGQWQPYAGTVSNGSFVTGVAESIGRSQNNTLDAGRVNAIRIINGSVRIYGARSLSADSENFKYLSIQETTNRIVIEAQNVLEDLVFSPIDGRRAIYGRIKSALMGVMEPLRSANALFPGTDASGLPTDSGYAIVVDDTINPLTQLATGVIKARIAFRMAGVTDTIQLEIVKSNLTTSIS
jgi:hypothetical protein